MTAPEPSTVERGSQDEALVRLRDAAMDPAGYWEERAVAAEAALAAARADVDTWRERFTDCHREHLTCVAERDAMRADVERHERSRKDREAVIDLANEQNAALRADVDAEREARIFAQEVGHGALAQAADALAAARAEHDGLRTLVVAVCADAQRDGRKIDPDELLAALEPRHV